MAFKPELEQHHVRYLEIDGEDEIILLTHEEHQKLHRDAKAAQARYELKRSQKRKEERK